jgi:hypothetical protein
LENSRIFSIQISLRRMCSASRRGFAVATTMISPAC